MEVKTVAMFEIPVKDDEYRTNWVTTDLIDVITRDRVIDNKLSCQIEK